MGGGGGGGLHLFSLKAILVLLSFFLSFNENETLCLTLSQTGHL